MYEADVFDFVAKIDKHTSTADLLVGFQRHAVNFGFANLIITGLPIGKQDMEPMVLMSNWPDGWYQRYAANHYADRDPVCLYAARTRNAFDWSEIPGDLRSRTGSSRVMNEAKAFGLRSGLLVPCASRLHWVAAVALASDQPGLKISQRERMALAFMATAVTRRAERLRGFDDPPDPLTMREREVLTRAAGGGTAAQLSEDMGMSEHTLVSHLANIRRKFGVKTTMQSVVRAIRLGLITP